MADAKRDLKIILTLNEEEARDLYIHLNPKYHPNDCEKIKKAIKKALGYEPKETPTIAGERIAFTLVIYTEGRASYLSSACREDSIRELKHLIKLFEDGMSDIPAHEIM